MLRIPHHTRAYLSARSLHSYSPPRRVLERGLVAGALYESRGRRSLAHQPDDNVIFSPRRAVGKGPTPNKPSSKQSEQGRMMHTRGPRAGSNNIDKHATRELTRLLPPIPAGRDSGFNGVNSIPSLVQLLEEYDTNAAKILRRVLPQEGVPTHERRLTFDATNPYSLLEDDPVVLVAHVSINEAEQAEKVVLCSGFFIDSKAARSGEGTEKRLPSGPILVSCAHTLEEVGIKEFATWYI